MRTRIRTDANTDPDRYAQGGDQDALLPYMGTVLIPELASHQFCLDSDADGPLPASCDEVYNDNEFKKNPGVAGIAVTGLTVEDGGPIEGLVLELRDPDGFLVGQGRTGDLGMDTTEVPLRDRCSFGRFPWLISQALSVTYMAGERRLYLERNCRLPESPAHSRRRNREGPASSKGLNSQRGFGPAVEPRRKSRPRSTSLHGSSPCKC